MNIISMRKFDRDVYDYPFDEQERHRTGESTFFDDVLYNIIFKDIGRTGLEEIASCAIISSTPDPQVTAVDAVDLNMELVSVRVAVGSTMTLPLVFELACEYAC